MFFILNIIPIANFNNTTDSVFQLKCSRFFKNCQDNFADAAYKARYHKKVSQPEIGNTGIA